MALQIDDRYIPKTWDFEECVILGYVWLSPDGVLKTNVNGVTLTPDRKHFIYGGKVYNPGLYYLILRENRVFLMDDDFVTKINAKPINALIEAKRR